MLPSAVSPYIPYDSEAFNDKQKIDTEYLYDQNGSTTADVNTGISTIQYNLLNLPDQIQFTEGHKNLYTYDASGKKLEAVNYTVNNIVNVPIGTISTLPASSSDYTKLTTDYVGNMIYENGSLKEILLPDGYWQNGVYYYYLKDHLGDNRVVINSSGAVIEKSHYYPSGMRFYPESTSNSAALPFRYNGKEMETMNGLNQMDYGARRRYSGLPIWTGPDDLREKYYSISPYAYCAGNPVRFIDVNGKEPGDFFLTMNAAARDFGKTYNDNSIRAGEEYGSRLYLDN
jgi:RHS repeat-associated protein